MLPPSLVPPRVCLLLVVLLAAVSGCDDMSGRSTNLFGTVTLDGEAEPGVEVEAEGPTESMFDTITGIDGSFGFIVNSGTYTVRLTNLPDDVSCDEGTEQQAVVPDGDSAMLTFTCETDVGTAAPAGSSNDDP